MKNPPFCDGSNVSRYGITLNINFDRNKDLKEVETFFYRYFKVDLMLISNVTIDKTNPFGKIQIIQSLL